MAADQKKAGCDQLQLDGAQTDSKAQSIIRDGQ